MRIPKPAARWTRQLAIGALVGLCGGLAAAALERSLHFGVENLVGRFAHLDGPYVLTFRWGVLLLPAVGGLISALVVQWLCPTAVGHGTDVLTRAFHRDLGALPMRGPTVKAVAAIGVISFGGSAGPEGPIAALGAAIGSSVGRLFSLTPRERRVMLIAGCAAGIGAIFQCPLGGALFAVGVLYSEPEYETDAIVPAFVASVIGYSAFIVAVPGTGHHMLQGTDQLLFEHPFELLPYAALGPLCGLLSIFFYLCMQAVESDIVPKTRLPRWLAPAFGGLATGALACMLPQVMDGQFKFIENAMNATLFEALPNHSWMSWAMLFGAVAVIKCLASAFTVGSGASGGLLGPSVFVGGAAGACVGALCQQIAPGLMTESLRQSLIPVGMAGVLAASMRVPLAAIVMVTEMTGSHGLIVPLMLVCSTAYVVGRRYGLNHEQVPTAAESPAHAMDSVVHILEAWTVESQMQRDWPLIASPEMRLPELMERVKPGTRPVFAVIDNERIVGVISVPDINRVMEDPHLADALIASDMMTEQLITLHPDDDLYHALHVFKEENHDVLPVVSRDPHKRWIGMLSRQQIFEALQSHMERMQAFVLKEHIGLQAIEREGQLQQLAMGVAPMHSDKIQRLMVPLEALDKSIRQCDFRKQFNAQIVAIEQPDGTLQCPPDLDTPLTTRQRLVAIVWQDPK